MVLVNFWRYPDPYQRFLIRIRIRPNDTDPTGSGSGSETLFSRYPESSLPDELQVQMNFDGLPLFKSSKQVLWPLICTFRNLLPLIVFPLIILCGTRKPTNMDFIEETLEQLNFLFINGMLVGGKFIRFKLFGIVADAPAR